MKTLVLAKLRSDFIAAISSDENDATLDPAIAELRDEISDKAFLEPFSINSRGQLGEIDTALSVITNVCLKDDPLRVALAVDAVLKLLDRLEIGVQEAGTDNERIEAGRSR
jgi:hypothetical protein